MQSYRIWRRRGLIRFWVICFWFLIVIISPPQDNQRCTPWHRSAGGGLAAAGRPRGGPPRGGLPRGGLPRGGLARRPPSAGSPAGGRSPRREMMTSKCVKISTLHWNPRLRCLLRRVNCKAQNLWISISVLLFNIANRDAFRLLFGSWRCSHVWSFDVSSLQEFDSNHVRLVINGISLSMKFWNDRTWFFSRFQSFQKSIEREIPLITKRTWFESNFCICH